METFLTPIQEDTPENQTAVVENTQYLVKDNWLGEYTTEEEKDLVRRNIKAAYSDNTYTKQETVDEITSRISQALEKYADFDPEKCVTDEEFNDKLSEFIRIDGTTPFAKVQNGVTPNNNSSNTALTTVEYVKNLLKGYLTSGKQQEILTEVTNILKNYALKNSVYTKEESSKEITSKLNGYASVSKNNRFTAPQSGLYTPTIGNHLTTKNYVDNLMYTHAQDFDPHGYTTILANKLKNYVLKSNVLDKTQTYTRAQIDSIIDRLVHNAVTNALESYKSLSDPHNILGQIKSLGYVKNDGTTSFKSPQKGIDAVDPQDFVTLHQVEDKLASIEKVINEQEPVWITSGPVETQVGMVKEGDILASSVTFQEAMDAIFYGKRVKLTVPELSNIGEVIPITLCIQGSLATVEYAEISQDGTYLDTITKEQLEESGCVTINGLSIDANSEITAKVYYTNGSIHEVTEIVKVALPVFVGIVPKWQFGNTITYNYLKELYFQDPQNNRFYDKGINLQSIEHNYNFDEDEEQKIIVALPAKYNDLTEMHNSAQTVSSAAFEIIDAIPFQIPGSTTDVVYKLYFYKQDLYSLNTTITFKFA